MVNPMCETSDHGHHAVSLGELRETDKFITQLEVGFKLRVLESWGSHYNRILAAQVPQDPGSWSCLYAV